MNSFKYGGREEGESLRNGCWIGRGRESKKENGGGIGARRGRTARLRVDRYSYLKRNSTIRGRDCTGYPLIPLLVIVGQAINRTIRLVHVLMRSQGMIIRLALIQIENT